MVRGYTEGLQGDMKLMQNLTGRIRDDTGISTYMKNTAPLSVTTDKIPPVLTFTGNLQSGHPYQRDCYNLHVQNQARALSLVCIQGVR